MRLKLFFISLLIFTLFTSMQVTAQIFSPNRCIGSWEGKLYIFGNGIVVDSVTVSLDVKKEQEHVWQWHLKYLSEKAPIEKNYKFKSIDTSKHFYIIDEGNGTELNVAVAGNKAFTVFGIDALILTSTYTLENNQLIFEVTSSKREEGQKDVVNYKTVAVQHVVFKRKA